MALRPNLSWRSYRGFNTQDSCRAYGHGAPLEGPVGTLPLSAALGRLGRTDTSMWSLLTPGTTSAVAWPLCWPWVPLPLW